MAENEQIGPEFEETLVAVNRSATVTKGGRNFSFSAVAVVGDRQGRVGTGFGKARDAQSAIEKGTKDAKRAIVSISLDGTTIPHEVIGRFGAARVFMKPASPGTGVIAGMPVRAVLVALGVRDALTKCYGTTNPVNVVKAVMEGLKRLRTKQQYEQLRGVKIE